MIQMSDLISKQDAIRLAEQGQIQGFEWQFKKLCTLPSAEPERKKGKWIITSEFEDCRYAKCNQCNVTQVFYYDKPLTNFCPDCGADMRGEQVETTRQDF